jgi:hypothetical protein
MSLGPSTGGFDLTQVHIFRHHPTHDSTDTTTGRASEQPDQPHAQSYSMTVLQDPGNVCVGGGGWGG